MKQSLKYNMLTIPNKLKVDIKILLDDKGAEYISDDNEFFSLSIYPLIIISIVRPFIVNEDGLKKKPTWNPNDSLILTKYNFPLLIRELEEIQKDLKIRELFSYVGDRLELNEDLADKIIRKIKLGNNAIELTPIIISKEEGRIEGIKLKINNEDSVIKLSINDLDSLIYNLKHMDIESISFMLYNKYNRKGKSNVRSDSWNK